MQSQPTLAKKELTTHAHQESNHNAHHRKSFHNPHLPKKHSQPTTMWIKKKERKMTTKEKKKVKEKENVFVKWKEIIRVTEEGTQEWRMEMQEKNGGKEEENGKEKRKNNGRGGEGKTLTSSSTSFLSVCSFF